MKPHQIKNFCTGSIVNWIDETPENHPMLRELKTLYGLGPFVVLNTQTLETQNLFMAHPQKLYLGISDDTFAEPIPLDTIFSGYWFKKVGV